VLSHANFFASAHARNRPGERETPQ